MRSRSVRNANPWRRSAALVRTGGEVSISFCVYGKPAQQGSKKGFVVKGRAIIVEANDKAKREWRQSVCMAAREAMNGRELLTGPVVLQVSFFFRRPKSHYGSGKNANKLKASAPVEHTQAPDLDKLVRNVGDGLTGTVLRDDSQICEILAGRSWTEEAERAVVVVDEISRSEEHDTESPENRAAS